MLQRVCLQLLIIFCVVQAHEFTLKAKIQPRVQIKEHGSYADSGDYLYDFHRIKVYTEYHRVLASNLSVQAMLSLNFSEKEIEEVAKEALIALSIRDNLLIETGQMKIPFYYSDYCGSSKIGHSYRNGTSDHLRNSLSIGGYQKGLIISGHMWDKRVALTAGAFYAKNIDIQGVSGSEPLMLPLFRSRISPFDVLTIEYGFIAPLFEAKMVDGALKRARVPMHSLRIAYAPENLYSASMELFWGADTARGKELMQLQESYDENLSFSLYFRNHFSIPLNEKLQLEPALAGEFLNGLTYYDALYRDRDYTYALYGSLALGYGKRLCFMATVVEQFDNRFSTLHRKRIALEATYAPTLFKRRK